MHTKTELLSLLRAHRLRLSKRLGQHYLIDSRVATRLVDHCRLSPEDTVVEIGAGLGALTGFLASRVKQVIAVEIDHGIADVLKARLADHPNVRVLCQDILAFDWSGYPGCKVVGAIPYPITSPILVTLCETPQAIPEVWLALQHEVASRLVAVPGTKAYGRLTILVQYRYGASSVMRIPRQAFFPQPRVTSTWVSLRARASPRALVQNEPLFFSVVRAAFSQRRKTLLNCLGCLERPRLDREQAAEAIHRAGLAARVRGEELSLAAFARLTDAVAQLLSI